MTDRLPDTAGDSASAEPIARALLDEANVWIIRQQEGRADQQDFAQWIGQSPTHAEAYRRAGLVYGALGAPAAKVAAHERKVTRRRAVASIAGLALGTWLLRDLPLRLTSTMTDPGVRRDFRLSDGSRIALNTDSAASFAFDETARRVNLKRGEAWFEVTSDVNRPFLVQAGEAEVRVVGTQFNVRRFSGDHVAVAVAEGHVEVRAGERSVGLNPGERATFRDGRFALSAVEPARVAEWRGGWLRFDQARFGDVIDELARYRDGPVMLFDRDLRARPISARLDIRNPDRALALAVKAAGAEMLSLPGGARVIY